MAGVIPVISEIYKNSDTCAIPASWATVALAFGAFFIAIDRFLGCTSGWIRYIRSSQKLSLLQTEFRMDWEKLRMSLQKNPADDSGIQNGMELCRDFLKDVYTVVKSETDQWAQDFQKSLAEFEEKGKSKP
jgi:hypothetical protein